MSVAMRPHSALASESWCSSPNSSILFRNKEYSSATNALDEYINEFDQDTSWQKAWNGHKDWSKGSSPLSKDVYDAMLQSVKSGSPDGKESSPKLGEMTIANVSKLPSSPLRHKDNDNETTITDLLLDGPTSQPLSRGSPVGHSASSGSPGKIHSPDRSLTPNTPRSQVSATRPKARRSLDKQLNGNESPYSKLHPDLPVGITRDPLSPLNKLKLPTSPLKQAEDATDFEIPKCPPLPSWVHDIEASCGMSRSKENLPPKVSSIGNGAASGINMVGRNYSILDSTSSSILGSDTLREIPKWLQEMEVEDVTSVLNLIDRQLKDRSQSDSLSTISMSFLSEDTRSSLGGSMKFSSIPGRKIFWETADTIVSNQNKVLTLNEKDKVRRRLVRLNHDNPYQFKTKDLRSSAYVSDDSLLEKPRHFFNPDTKSHVSRSKSVDRLSFSTAKSVSNITNNYLPARTPSVDQNRDFRSNPSLNRHHLANHSAKGGTSPRGLSNSLGSVHSITPGRERTSKFTLSKVLSPAVPKKSLERTRSMSAYDEFKSQASRVGRSSSPIKYKSLFLDDTSVHTSRKSPRSERADKMIKSALSLPVYNGSTTTANTESLLNAKITPRLSFDSSFSTAEKVNLLDKYQYKNDVISKDPPGSMETLKNILFTMQNVASSTANIFDGRSKVDDMDPSLGFPMTTTHSTNSLETPKDFESEIGGQVLQKAFMHLSKLKSLVSEEVPATEDQNERH